MKTCNGCKYATWKRKANGTLHPSGDGRCGYVVRLPVLPASISGTYFGKEAVRAMENVMVGSRAIDRNREFADHCPTYSPMEIAGGATR